MSNKEDNRYYYTFLGWGTVQNGSVEAGCLDNISADTTVYAIYSRVEKTFTVRLYNGSTLLQTYSNVAYGSTISDLPTPTYNGPGKASDYRFTGWSPLPSNVTADIDCYAQYEFLGLYFRAYMESTLTNFVDTEDLTTIASFAFAGESYLEAVSMPSLTAVPSSCFRACPSLVSVDLPAVIATNDYAFGSSTQMTELRLPELMLLNSSPLLYLMTALTALRLPKNTSSLNSMIISTDNIEILDVGVAANIGTRLTSGFSHLTYLIVRNTSQVATVPTSNFISSSSPIAEGTGKILVPRAMVDSYKADADWGNYASVIEAIEDYPAIANPS